MSYTINSSIRARYYNKTPRSTSSIKYIVLHYTANSGTKATAKGNANYFHNTDRKASAHYVCDEGNVIYQCVPDTNAAYAVGDKQKYTNGGAQLKGKCTNSNSISIEMVSHTDSKGNYYIPEATINHAVELTRALMSKYHIPSSNVTRHWSVTGKLCPAPMCHTTEGNARWKDFMNKLTGANQAPQKEEEEMTQEQFNAMMKEYRKTLQDNDCNAYSAEAREWAIKNGIVTGSGKDAKGEPNYMWADQLSREQAVTIFYRFAKLMGKA